jgi:fused signal recognition particle receptor
VLIESLKNSWQKIKNAVSRVKQTLLKPLYTLLGRDLDESTLSEIEQLLYEADFGIDLSQQVVKILREHVQAHGQQPPSEYLSILKKSIYNLCYLPNQFVEQLELMNENQLKIIFIAGINGSGKTTSIAKLAYRYQKMGKKVLLAAADTFRAAAVDQLDEWAKRIDVELIRGKQGADPSSIVYDAIIAAKSRGHDLVLIDTAGRLHNKQTLMHELEKMTKVAQKVDPQAHQDFILVLDAVIGQNALVQAKLFSQVSPLKAVILTKVDGAAKGGIALVLQQLHKIPIAYIGTGEGIEDIEVFDLNQFINGMFDE